MIKYKVMGIFRNLRVCKKYSINFRAENGRFRAVKTVGSKFLAKINPCRKYPCKYPSPVSLRTYVQRSIQNNLTRSPIVGVSLRTT